MFLDLSSDKLDDEVAASVYENPDKMPDMDSITHLTFDNFHEAVAQSSLTVAVFYFKCDVHCCLLAYQRGETNEYKFKLSH